MFFHSLLFSTDPAQRALRLIACGLALCAPAAARADDAAEMSVASGRGVAYDECSPCHIVAEHQIFSSRTISGPPFHQIANAPNTSAFGLRRIITGENQAESGHLPRLMPVPNLTPEEVNDVIAYILSLRDQPNAGAEPIGTK